MGIPGLLNNYVFFYILLAREFLETQGSQD